jgi:hypothetical protein
MTVTHVYLLWHIHDLGDEYTPMNFQSSSSPEMVNAAKERVARLPGIRDNPESFRIEQVVLDQDLWTEGFETVEEGLG